MSTPYNQVFGGSTIYPATLTFLPLTMTADVTLQWPIEQAIAGQSVFADIIEITANAGLSLIMPNATKAAPGQATLVNNVGAQTVTVKDSAGNAIGSVASGQSWEFYLKDNTTAAGVWRTFQFGTGASSAVAAALAGAGLKAITTTLNQRYLPRSSASPVAIVDADRASIVQYTGGVGTGTLPTPASVGTDWFVFVRNNGTGTVTFTPAAGSINGNATLALGPGSSTMIYTDGANYFTLGLSQITPTNFDFTSINVAGTGTYVLSGTELNRISYKLTGVLSGARIVQVPNTVQQYWVNNATTGAFSLTVKTAAGAGVVVPQGASMLLYCDGTDVIAAEGAPTSGLIPVLIGGTGLAAFAQGDMLYASAANVLAALAKNVTATRYIANTGAGNSPTWDQINLANGVTGRLPFSNLTQAAGFSVLGNFSNVVADMAPIVGGANQVLRVDNAGTSLAFGLVNMAASVFNVLGAVNGGTDQSSVAQGDLLYSSVANAWTRLAKDASGLKFLSNQGASNGPSWLTMRFGVTGAANSDITFALTDLWNWIPHTGAATQIWTIPTNASVAAPIGSMIGLDNRAGANTIAVTPAGGVTLDGHGGTGTFNLPAGYKAILIKVDTNTWAIMTDAPVSGAAIGAGFDGYVNLGGGALPGSSVIPTGWSLSRTSAGIAVVTHNLGLTNTEGLAVTCSVVNSSGNTNAYRVAATANTFTINTLDSGTGTLTDQDFCFHAVRIAA